MGQPGPPSFSGDLAVPDAAQHVAVLLGVDSPGFLGAAVGAAGGTLISSRPKQVYHQPRQGAIASYAARVRWRDESVSDETLVACTGDLPAGALVVESGSDRVAVWRFPNDPDLPGLASAHNEAAVARLLAELGLGDGPVRLKVRAYRPRRRAVIEAVGDHGRLFVKALRPHRVEQLHDRHRLLVASGVPAPHSLGWSNDGLLVLQALPGRTLREAIYANDGPLPSGEAILALLDRLPAELAAGPRRGSWLDRVNHYATIVGAIVPDEADRAHRIADAISAEAGVGPTVAVHGDFYENQLLVHGTTISGLLDVDGARAGDRLDDLACLLGHLSVLAQIDRRRASALNAVGAGYLASFEHAVDPADLRYRTAAVVVSLVTGPHRVQATGWPETTQRLLDLADRWLASARKSRRRAMRNPSPRPHDHLTATAHTELTPTRQGAPT